MVKIYVQMVVSEFVNRASQKIFLLGCDILPKVGFKSVCCPIESIYELSEAIEVVQDSLTTAECIEDIICLFVEKYCLNDVDIFESAGINFMSIDSNDTCNVFRIYV